MTWHSWEAEILPVQTSTSHSVSALPEACCWGRALQALHRWQAFYQTARVDVAWSFLLVPQQVSWRHHDLLPASSALALLPAKGESLYVKVKCAAWTCCDSEFPSHTKSLPCHQTCAQSCRLLDTTAGQILMRGIPHTLISLEMQCSINCEDGFQNFCAFRLHGSS